MSCKRCPTDRGRIEIASSIGELDSWDAATVDRMFADIVCSPVDQSEPCAQAARQPGSGESIRPWIWTSGMHPIHGDTADRQTACRLSTSSSPVWTVERSVSAAGEPSPDSHSEELIEAESASRSDSSGSTVDRVSLGALTRG